jgi:uncharacterized protein YjiS (DUF1127 family)
MTVIAKVRSAVAKWLQYMSTRRALENLPLDVALDLDIYRGDARRIATQAVYG